MIANRYILAASFQDSENLKYVLEVLGTSASNLSVNVFPDKTYSPGAKFV